MPDATTPPGGQKLHIDTDWKTQAQSEKERLAKQEEQRATETPGQRPGELPPAEFRTLVDMLASQAFMGLGAMADPKTGRVVIDLEGSKFSIDLLEVLEQKTTGNLTPDETRDLKQVLAALRARFVQILQIVAKQAATGGVAAPAMPAAGPQVQL